MDLSIDSARGNKPESNEHKQRPTQDKRERHTTPSKQLAKYGYMVTNTMYSTQFYGLERIVKCEKLPLSGSGRA